MKGILLSDGSREDKFLALQYLSKDLNLSKSCSNDDEAKAYEKAYKLMIELDKVYFLVMVQWRSGSYCFCIVP